MERGSVIRSLGTFDKSGSTIRAPLYYNNVMRITLSIQAVWAPFGAGYVCAKARIDCGNV